MGLEISREWECLNRNAPSIHPSTPQINERQHYAVGFTQIRPTEIIQAPRSLASLHRHSEIPGRGVQQPAHTSLPVGHFRPSATTSSHSSNLANHIRPGTIERPYGCPNCHKKFVHESDLRQHVVIHTRKRVFACTLCEKSFVSPSKLQVHQNVHTGEKPFSCAQCGRRFSQSSNLNRHQKHSLVPGTMTAVSWAGKRSHVAGIDKGRELWIRCHGWRRGGVHLNWSI
uniref:C2H2-type domain-containing protein n=1 Tax=Oncorhynchus kisutch TaxID=8019 RepID=A0A8C7K0P3_ONCKI